MDSEISKDELYTEKLMNMILDVIDDRATPSYG